MKRFRKALAVALVGVCAGGAAAPRVFALTSPDYSPEKNDFFTTWSPAGPVVRNTSGNFVGAGYDWSGAFSFTTVSSPTQWTPAMRGFFSPSHVARAAHMTAISATVPNITTGMDNARTPFSTTAVNRDFRAGYNLGVYTQYGYDLAVSSIGLHVAPDSGVAVYAVPDFDSYANRVIFLTGHGGGKDNTNSPRVMEAKITSESNQKTVVATQFSENAYSQAQFQGGDSGYSAFIGTTDPAGNKQLLLLGVNSAVGGTENFLSTYGSTAGINAVNGFTTSTGFALRLVGEAATAWTGTASTSFATAGNWVSGVPLTSNYVTFDSASSTTQTVDLGGAAREMRGVVFHPGSAGKAFTFANGTLTLGRGGLANYSAETQIFSSDIRLTDHQVWDATQGGYLAQAGVNLNGKLLMVQGDYDTTIAGVVSDSAGNAPGLTKYGLGKLTLQSAATYTGTTWLYGGTLALTGNGALPTNTKLIIGNNDTSRLELNGKTATLSRLVTSESISGGQGVVDLGGGGRIDLYNNALIGHEVFAARITGGTAGTLALRIGGWQAVADNPVSFALAAANTYSGQTILRGQSGENGGAGLSIRIANPQALGAAGVGNETIIQYTDTSKPYVRFVTGGTYQESLILDVATAATQAVTYEAAGETLTFMGDHTISRTVQNGSNQRVEMRVRDHTTVNFGAIRGELGTGGVAATGSFATTLWLWADAAKAVVNLNGEVSDGSIKGAGTRGLALDLRGAGAISINHTNSYTGLTSVRSRVTANVDALEGAAGAFGNATSAVTIGAASSAYGQALYAGDGVTIGRAITVNDIHTGALALGAEDNATALFSGNVTLYRQADLASGAGSQVTFSGSLLQAGNPVTLNKTGAGTVILSGANTHTGGTAVQAGTLVAKNANALGMSGATSVSAGTLVIATGVTLANANLNVSGGVLLNHGTVNALNFTSGTLGGHGIYNTAVNFTNAATDILAPGASVGLTSFGTSQTWGALNYQWEVQDFAQGALAGSGFDSVAIAGGLTLDDGAYTLEIHSLNAQGGAGLVGNYEAQARQWAILEASGGITGFDASAWTIAPGAFMTFHPGGSFNLGQNGNALILSYAPIPEPSTIALFLLAGGVVILRRFSIA